LVRYAIVAGGTGSAFRATRQIVWFRFNVFVGRGVAKGASQAAGLVVAGLKSPFGAKQAIFRQIVI
jgi:hypothetical protein